MKIIKTLVDNEYPFSEITHTRITLRCLIFNNKNEIALIKVKGNDIFGKRDYYEIPGGGLKEDESFIQGLKREIKEEVGCGITDIKEIGIIEDYYNLIKRKNINLYYMAKCVGDIFLPILEEYEKGIFEEIVWVSIDKAIALYKSKTNTKLGRLLCNRELPILEEVKTLLIEN